MDLPFLRIPPFPGHRAPPLARKDDEVRLSDAAVASIIKLLRQERVGGSFWGARPRLAAGCALLAPDSPAQARQMVETARAEGLADRCMLLESRRGLQRQLTQRMALISGANDPWHLAQTAAQLWVSTDSELALVAALAERPVRIFGRGGSAESTIDDESLVRMIRHLVGGHSYVSPFSGAAVTPVEAIETLSEWRRLIDRNREITAVFGVAGWKRPTVDPMLWDGNRGPRHLRDLPSSTAGDAHVAIWKSRTPTNLLRQIDQSGLKQAEIEDGMIRGRGLGANCVPPLSIVVDESGIYFDPSQTSDLEFMLESADMDEALQARAARLRQRIVAEGISKYAGETGALRTSVGRRQVLVVGQVEDDRSILSGGGGQTNLDLLQRTRSIEADAWLIYRPHPDVEAGHRKGHIPDEAALRYANEIERGGSIISLIESVDELHCITSLAGFEALLRDKPVTTHGVPFYAGWGLTRDLADIPARRTRRRSLDELVAATLILYPRYIDPMTRLPCQPEILIERLALGEAGVSAPLSGMRKLQGKLKVAARRLREAAA